MSPVPFGRLFRAIVLQSLLITRNVLSIQKREWIGATAELTEGDVSCFSDYMEMWIHSGRIEGLRVWLSGALHSQVNLASLDQLNLQLSACGFSLHKDPEKNFMFRVIYTGCLVQQQNGFHVLTMNLVKRISRFGGRPHSLTMKCPVVSVLPSKEKIQCDPEYIQVIRKVPHDNWNNELQWSLSLSDHFIVAVEDASLVQMTIVANGPDVTVQGRRSEVMNPVKVMGDEAEFLALKLVSGQYAYSMEAVCPKVTTSMSEETVLHIFKRRMGLIKRGGLDHEGLTVMDVSVNQTNDFTVHETSEFVTLVIPTTQIIKTKSCAKSKQLLQSFYKVDVVLTFKETNHKMHWSMENTLPCTAGPASHTTPSPAPNTSVQSTLGFLSKSLTTERPPSDRPAAPTERPNKTEPLEETRAAFSTTGSPQTQTDGGDAFTSQSQPGNLSSAFDADAVVSVNSTTDFPFNAALERDQDDQQFNGTSGNQVEQKQKQLKWIWW